MAAGFAKIGICRPDEIAPAADGLRAFLAQNYHGEMDWMAKRAALRAAPSALWPDVRTILMFADLYTPDSDPMAILKKRDKGAISVYARNHDYHDIIKKRLKAVGRWMVAEKGCAIKIFVDTAPVMEKPLAAAAGLGWQGKHTNLVARDLGSWFFLGAIFTDMDIPPDALHDAPVDAPCQARPHRDMCGSCRACLDICPTKAFPAPYQLDARRCISYLTIEHKGPVAPKLRPALGNRIYGCDDCLAVCPWNKFAKTAHELRYHARPELTAPALADLALLDDTKFRQLFSRSPIKRIGVGRFLRNVLYAIGNSRQKNLLWAAKRHCQSADPTVRDAAHWAVAQIAQEGAGRHDARWANVANSANTTTANTNTSNDD